MGNLPLKQMLVGRKRVLLTSSKILKAGSPNLRGDKEDMVYAESRPQNLLHHREASVKRNERESAITHAVQILSKDIPREQFN